MSQSRGRAQYVPAQTACRRLTQQKKSLLAAVVRKTKARDRGTGPNKTQANPSRGKLIMGKGAGPLLDDDDEDVALRRSGLACVFTREGSMMNNGRWVKVAADLENLT